MMVSGDELATAASQAFDSKMKFKSISDSEAQDILDDIPSDEMDDSEKLFLVEYYSLVKQVSPSLPLEAAEVSAE